ncbi:MAG: phosphatidylserine/phosphatidylglycerophosphate/cardiolipin synthase family protein [Planctomycetota bacterium]|nr:MAG: phosphatidylserine/phosphatidylglycerophosphate/cardiolipin synthase family protein [Planctomycetota bacterium]
MPAGVLRAPYPFREAPEVELFTEARPTWDRLLADLSSARSELRVENFIFSDGLAGAAVADALVRAATNGARVRLQIDAFGSKGLGDASRRRLRAAGVELRIYNRLRLGKALRPSRAIPRTHRRIVTVDDRVGWTGGLAFADQWWPSEGREAARDTMVRFTGAAVADLADAFDRLWEDRRRGPRPELPAGCHGQLRVVPQYTLRYPHYNHAFMRRLAFTQRRAWIAVPYFVPGPNLFDAFRALLRRRVDLRFLFPGRRTDHPAVRIAARRHYGRLLRAGARIWEYQPSFMHAKTALFDDEWLLAGSCNLDSWSMFINNEIAVEICDPGIAGLARHRFELDFSRAREVTWEEWRRRPLPARLLERLFGTFESAF